jgi:hypothetical protein
LLRNTDSELSLPADKEPGACASGLSLLRNTDNKSSLPPDASR